MQEFISLIEEMRLVAGKHAIQLSLPAGMTLGFGQYLQASALGDLLPTVIYPQTLVDNTLLSTPEISSSWKIGNSLRLRGPLGKRFQLPASTKHLVCVSARDSGHIFMPLITSALLQNTSIVTCIDTPTCDLPDQIEIQSIQNFPELVCWADLIMVNMEIDQIDYFRQLLGNATTSPPIFVVLHVPMPCAGTSDCGLCAVQTLHGIKLACQEGLLFDWHELRSAP